METIRALRAAFWMPVIAIATTVIGVEQIQAGGEGVSNGIRALIASAVFWVFAIMAVRNLFNESPSPEESAGANAADPHDREMPLPDAEPPQRLM